MSSLNKLAIRGIRSFDDKNLSVIEFFSPVTVIVGHNGSGKTTIIECLKYATTGDQPPGTRGGAFIHDPKMANEKEVKAQVKLRFDAANGTRMLVVRNLSVTVKKNGSMTMKTLESILGLADGNIDRGGKRGVISTKCAEMDAEIPHLLGVSRAVLDNVIFCHQEDSYWPLSEPATLKKKFDDIFEATKYTKALDAIKNLRKERMAELKVEKERLEGLVREKRHADRLESSLADLISRIAAKEVEFEETQKRHQEVVMSNKRFLEQASRFREIYMRTETAQRQKDRLEEELREVLVTVQELEDTDDALQGRLTNFNAHIARQKRAKREHEAKTQDKLGDLNSARRKHVELVNEQGQLAAEANAQEARITEREGIVRTLASQHRIRGYDASPLEDQKVVEFTSQLSALQRRWSVEMERLQRESKAKDTEYLAKSRQLHSEQDSLKHRRNSAQERISKLRSDIMEAERQIESAESLEAELEALLADREDKSARLEKTKTEIMDAKYEDRISQIEAKKRELEMKREACQEEIGRLNLQADQRAKRELHQNSVSTKEREIKSIMSLHSLRFRKLLGADAQVDTMESEVEQIITEKEKECAELEEESTQADRVLHDAQAQRDSTERQLRDTQTKLTKLQRKLSEGLRDDDKTYDSVTTGLKEIKEEIDLIQVAGAKVAMVKKMWNKIIESTQAHQKCFVCMQRTSEKELAIMSEKAKEEIAAAEKSDDMEGADLDEDLKYWKAALSRIQDLLPVETEIKQFEFTQIPKLKDEIQVHNAALLSLEEAASRASERLLIVKKVLKDLAQLRKAAADVSRLHLETQELVREIDNLDQNLASSGLNRTVFDAQRELDSVGVNFRQLQRERDAIDAEKKRRENALYKHKEDLFELMRREDKLRAAMDARQRLRDDVKNMEVEVLSQTRQIGELEILIQESQKPINLLEREHEIFQRESSARLSQAQEDMQAVNISVQKLEDSSRVIERYIREKRARKLEECMEKIAQFEAQITNDNAELELLRSKAGEIEKEINEGGAVLASIRENLRVRRLRSEITELVQELDSIDIDEAAKAKRNFDDRYPVEQKKESELAAQSSYIGGELNSLKAQQKGLEREVREYKDANKKYNDQLVKVKMSDMANSDLEKYAKALDNAIMKYHSMKMEEVNDTMRHLWSKTYQGTDIDGIMIRSDSEGGATKRSYNYRVVMTKDQVEMDMRGRCSAGQKMLASIIIRLALSDSFGQNCGILALDEPTNALDTENIDALAESLVDIINERKNHSNFQLIIITHDENFLRKLGQSDVVEYYWRVSRDSRQKSVIERHRFG
ncbi:hypothetical protein K488DRAFT_87770 [Vararia minispora EC-137]|uniref:Uncharacterized protein n=1 Tax=Vararia minispora EC-137 TaxID=1314806 RepID=A0ACB8QFJ3_9AGAM|nr:hypothetical protein K488DRAFT_87770 [Vararia minispora EC-137]